MHLGCGQTSEVSFLKFFSSSLWVNNIKEPYGSLAIPLVNLSQQGVIFRNNRNSTSKMDLWAVQSGYLAFIFKAKIWYGLYYTRVSCQLSRNYEQTAGRLKVSVLMSTVGYNRVGGRRTPPESSTLHCGDADTSLGICFFLSVCIISQNTHVT